MLLDALIVQQGIHIRVQGTVADADVASPQDGIARMRPVLFRFRAVEPKGIPSFLQQWTGKVFEVEVASRWDRSVIDVRIGYEQMLRIHSLISIGAGIEQPPGGDHGMDVFGMELLQVAGNIVVVGIELGIALSLPPEPVLHHDVQRDVLLTVATGNRLNLVE